MTTLAADQVVKLAHDVGVPRSQLTTCVAIAWAESGLSDSATGVNRDPETHEILSRDRGLWQINDYWHPDVSDACAYDAACNAGAMYRISNGGTNWMPWSTFNSGAYRAFMTASQLAVNYYFVNIAPGGSVLPPIDGTYRGQLLQFVFQHNSAFYNRDDVVAAERQGRWDDVAGEYLREYANDFWVRSDIVAAWAANRKNDVYGEFIKEGGTTPSGIVPPPAPSPGQAPPDNSGQITSDIAAGHGPISTTARLLQRIVDETMDAKHGPGHRTGPIMGGIIQ